MKTLESIIMLAVLILYAVMIMSLPVYEMVGM